MTVDLVQKKAQLEVRLLRAQFNSHFLFNNFYAINYHLLQNDPQTASVHLMLFSRLMRRLLADSQQDFTRLSEEIETISLYVQIESTLFSQLTSQNLCSNPLANSWFVELVIWEMVADLNCRSLCLAIRSDQIMHRYMDLEGEVSVEKLHPLAGDLHAIRFLDVSRATL